MKQDEIDRVIASASSSVGLAASEQEREVIRAVAREALRARSSLASIDELIEQVGVQHEATRRIAEVVGKVTAVILVAYLGDFSEYASAAALEKACGLNLKIKSSGNVTGRRSITKRGASETRAMLYLAAMRLVKSHPLIRGTSCDASSRSMGPAPSASRARTTACAASPVVHVSSARSSRAARRTIGRSISAIAGSW